MSAQNRDGVDCGAASARMRLLMQSQTSFSVVYFGQNAKVTLPFNINYFMSFSKLACVAALIFCGAVWLALPTKGLAQTNYYASNGSEYAVVGALPGDQVFPDVAITPTGGYVVWQDNVTDGSGWGVSAERLDSTMNGTLSSFRVNVQGTNDQENPRVAILKNGGAAFVWQGGVRGAQHIFARFLTPTNTWLTSTDLVVGTFTNTFQISPALTVLNDSNVVVVWSSYDQAGPKTQLDVYGAILSPTGQTVSNAFLINQFTNFNQRSPVVVAMTNGGFAVAWVSEQERAPVSVNASQYYISAVIPTPSVDIYARLYRSNGVAITGEFLVNSNSGACANPSLAAAADGSFLVAWSQHDPLIATNGWDVFARPFSGAGVGGPVVQVNTMAYGDQYAPKVKGIGLDYLVVFTSLGQDGSREGVFGQFVHNNGALIGGEIQVNTTWVGQQMQPAVASDGAAWFQVVWTSYSGPGTGFDLYAQRYANVAAILQPLGAPFVYAPFNLVNNKYVPQLQVSWPPILGIAISNYEVYVDGSPRAITNWLGTSNQWTMGPANGLTTNSTHSFQVAYLTTDGRQSPLSTFGDGTTWSGLNYYGIPDEWIASYYGDNNLDWPANVYAPLVPGGMSLYNVFLSGGNPLDPSTWLTTYLTRAAGGMYLNWNTQPGLTYQVQSTRDLKVWNNLGSPRFAAGTTDSIFVGGTPVGYYRVLLLRP